MKKHHGGKRKGAGRPPLPDKQKRKNVTVKALPGADVKWGKLAKSAGVSKGGVVEWLVASPEAAAVRNQIREVARYYCDGHNGRP